VSSAIVSHIVPDEGLKLGLRLPHDEMDLIAAVRSEELAVTPLFTYGGSNCSKCGSEYADCPDIRGVDAGVGQSMRDMTIVFVCWTDRHAQNSRRST
jgi:hypothetical protein